MINEKQILKWIDAPDGFSTSKPFLKAKFIAPVQNRIRVQLIQDQNTVIEVPQANCHEYSTANDFNDMCQMSILNQPQILSNIKQRFFKQQIFTHIGSTLLVVNPYESIKALFNPKILQFYKQLTLKNQLTSQLKPHIYLLAGKSYSELIKTNKKQTIIISGESGAGKTQCTKFCLQLLTSLSRSSEHSIQDKILSCNPILQAFGNSKTVRNDNSSRFGKYVQIYFDEAKNIVGAKIKSYLLEKSRVVQLEKQERNYHCFYALVAGFKNIQQAKHYNYLQKSNCYNIKNLNDEQNFAVISKSMKIVGFSETQIQRIWQILRCILEIGNLQVDDSQHEKDESKTCMIKNKQILDLISKILGRKAQQIQKFFLYQKRKFLKQFLLTPYNSLSCRANMDSLSKQLYSKAFEFILTKINQKLQPSSPSLVKNEQSSTINILDIFGFQNFQKNSFQQICINYTNEKLLNLYNRYIFSKQLEILKEDGLAKTLHSIQPPNNQVVLELLHSRKVSLFSIVNDLTPHQQFKDSDILSSIRKQLKNQKIEYPMNIPNSFVINHSQCSVQYRIEGFKTKNKDKIKQQVLHFTESLFQPSSLKITAKSLQSYSAYQGPPSATKQSKTLLSKFTTQIQSLMSKLQQSTVHFVRCLKPNNQKKPLQINQKYLLNQIRYLGVFETIRIRKFIFPCRKTYEQFKKQFNELFSKNVSVQQLLKKFDKNEIQFILGKKRVYISPVLQQKLLEMLQKIRKIKIQCAKKILNQYRTYKFRKIVLKNLKTLKKKIRILTKYSLKNYKQNLSIVVKKLWKHCLESRLEQRKTKQQKVKQQKQSKDKIKKQLLNRRTQLMKNLLPEAISLIQKYARYQDEKIFIERLFKIKQKYEQDKKQQNEKIEKQKLQKSKQQRKQKNKQFQSNKQKLKIIQKENQKEGQTQQKQLDTTKENYNSRSSYQSVTTVLQQNQVPYYRDGSLSPSNKMKKDKKLQQNKIFSFPKQFMNYNSVVRTQQTVLFRYNLKIDLFDATKGKQKLMKLKQIAKKQSNGQQQKDLADSIYVNFKSSDINKQTYNKILSFSQQEFCEKYLRKRSKLVGKPKSFNQIFTSKRKPLQKSLSRLQKQDEQYALKIFKQILRINQQGNQQFILKITQNFISLIVEAPQQIVNESYIQLIKQINSDRQEESIKVYKLMLAYLHFFRPDQQFLEAGMYVLFQKLQCKLYTENQESYLRLVFQKTYNKYIKLSNTKYIPSKYQLYCLICKKLFPFNFYLAMGNCVQYNVQSDQTFNDIKSDILDKFGVNINRISPKYFSFFQIITFEEGQMEQIPISDYDIVWDVKSYLQIAISRYQEHKITPPKFYFLLKLKFPFELQIFDYQGIQLIYAECFFDYFTGKIRVPQAYLMQLAHLIVSIKQIQFDDLNKNYVYGVFPLWAIRKYGDQGLLNGLKEYNKDHNERVKDQEKENDEMQKYKRKFNFVKILQKFPLAMSIAIPPDSDLLTQSSLLYYLKPRRLYVVQKENMQILEQYQLKKMLYWEVDEEKLCFQFQEEGTSKTKTHIFYTQYAQLFSDYLREIGELMKNGL